MFLFCLGVLRWFLLVKHIARNGYPACAARSARRSQATKTMLEKTINTAPIKTFSVGISAQST